VCVLRQGFSILKVIYNFVLSHSTDSRFFITAIKPKNKKFALSLEPYLLPTTGVVVEHVTKIENNVRWGEIIYILRRMISPSKIGDLLRFHGEIHDIDLSHTSPPLPR